MEKGEPDQPVPLVKKSSKTIKKPTNGKNVQTNESRQSRKRKLSPKRQAVASSKKLRAIGKQWTHPALEPMVRHLTSNPRNIFRMRHAHHTILQIPVQPNVLTAETLFNHFEITTPYTVGLPVPIHTTTGPIDKLPDLMIRFLFAKENYRRELLSVHAAYKRIELHRSWPRVGLRTVEEDEHVQNSAAVIYAALLDRDPDPYLLLDSGYDYHFTGGSLAAVSSMKDSGPVATVFKAVGENLEEVEVIELEQSEERTHGELTAKRSANCLTYIPGPILEIVADVRGRFVLVRKRHVIVVLRRVACERQGNGDTSTRSSNDTEWCATQRIISTVPIASVCIVRLPSSVKRTISVCTVDYQRLLRLWRIDRKEEAKEQCEEKLPKIEPCTLNDKSIPNRSNQDNWSAVRCIDGRSLVACLDRYRIHLYSIREKTETNQESDGSSADLKVGGTMHLVHRGSSNFSQWILPCERCCALEVAPAGGLIFIATCHKLLIAKVDSEQSGHESRHGSDGDSSSSSNENELLKVNVLIMFAHNLRQRPVFLSYQKQWQAATCEGDSAAGDEQHFLLFGSHLPMSYGVCSFAKSIIKEPEGQNGSEQPRYFTRHLPLHPRTFHDAYKLAQSKGYCLSANEPLRRRFYACQSGVALIPAGKGECGRIHIVLQTSGGDLLQQSIVARDQKTIKNLSCNGREQNETEQVAETLRYWHTKLLEGSEKLPYKATNFRTLKKFRNIFNCPSDPNELKDLVFRPPDQAKEKAKRDAARRRRQRRKGSTGRLRRRYASSSSESSSDASWPVSSRDSEVTERSADTTESPRQRFSKRQEKHLPWRQTIEEIQEYKDVLAHALLEVWGYGEARSAAAPSDLNHIRTQLPPVEDAIERVGCWMATTTADQLATNNEDTSTIEPKEKPLRQGRSEPGHKPTTAPASNRVETLFNGSGLNCFTPESPLSQWPMSVPLTQGFEADVKRKPSTNARPAKKKYVKGF